MKKIYLIFIFSSILVSFLSSSKISNSYIYPTNITYISSYYGYREIFGKQNFHNGIDFPASIGSNVYATQSGIVTFCGYTSGYGMCIIILHADGTKTLYGHLSEEIIVKNGDNIYQGQIIGYIGPVILSNGLYNGLTTGPHLHFSIYNENGNTIDPLSLELKKRE